MRKNQVNYSLYLVTDRNLSRRRKLEDIILSAVQGGATVVQLREKECSTKQYIEFAKSVQHILRPQKIPLIINDRVDVALAVDADGVHVGQSDMPYQDARRILGKDKIIGLSVESIEDALTAEKYDCDYLGLSPVFSTPTKTDITHELGLDGVRAIRKISHHKLIAIGGINRQNCAEIINAGADGIAVVSAICSADDPQKSASELRKLVDETLENKA